MLSYDSREEQGAACGQLESFMLEHNGRFNSRDYDKFERIKLMESPVRDAIANLKSIPSKRSRNASIYAFLGAVSAFLRVLIAKTAVILLYAFIHPTRTK